MGTACGKQAKGVGDLDDLENKLKPQQMAMGMAKERSDTYHKGQDEDDGFALQKFNRVGDNEENAADNMGVDTKDLMKLRNKAASGMKGVTGMALNAGGAPQEVLTDEEAMEKLSGEEDMQDQGQTAETADSQGIALGAAAAGLAKNNAGKMVKQFKEDNKDAIESAQNTLDEVDAIIAGAEGAVEDDADAGADASPYASMDNSIVEEYLAYHKQLEHVNSKNLNAEAEWISFFTPKDGKQVWGWWKKEKETTIFHYKLEMIIPSITSDDFLEMVHPDVRYGQPWDTVSSWETLDRNDQEHQSTIHIVMTKPPVPLVSQRDVCIKVVNRKDYVSKGVHIQAWKSVEHANCPEGKAGKKVVRGSRKIGGMYIEPHAEGTKLTTIMQFNMHGSLQSALRDKAIQAQPLGLYDNAAPAALKYKK